MPKKKDTYNYTRVGGVLVPTSRKPASSPPVPQPRPITPRGKVNQVATNIANKATQFVNTTIDRAKTNAATAPPPSPPIPTPHSITPGQEVNYTRVGGVLVPTSTKPTTPAATDVFKGSPNESELLGTETEATPPASPPAPVATPLDETTSAPPLTTPRTDTVNQAIAEINYDDYPDTFTDEINTLNLREQLGDRIQQLEKLQAPAPFDSRKSYEEILGTRGIDSLEKRRDDVNMALQGYDKEFQARLLAETTSFLPQGAIDRNVANLRSIYDSRVNALQNELAIIQDEIQVQNTYALTMVELEQQDYSNAVNAFTQEYNKQLQLLQLESDLILTELDYEQKQKQIAWAEQETLLNLLANSTMKDERLYHELPRNLREQLAKISAKTWGDAAVLPTIYDTMTNYAIEHGTTAGTSDTGASIPEFIKAIEKSDGSYDVLYQKPNGEFMIKNTVEDLGATASDVSGGYERDLRSGQDKAISGTQTYVLIDKRDGTVEQIWSPEAERENLRQKLREDFNVDVNHLLSADQYIALENYLDDYGRSAFPAWDNEDFRERAFINDEHDATVRLRQKASEWIVNNVYLPQLEGDKSNPLVKKLDKEGIDPSLQTFLDTYFDESIVKDDLGVSFDDMIKELKDTNTGEIVIEDTNSANFGRRRLTYVSKDGKENLGTYWFDSRINDDDKKEGVFYNEQGDELSKDELKQLRKKGYFKSEEQVINQYDKTLAELLYTTGFINASNPFIEDERAAKSLNDLYANISNPDAGDTGFEILTQQFIAAAARNKIGIRNSIKESLGISKLYTDVPGEPGKEDVLAGELTEEAKEAISNIVIDAKRDDISFAPLDNMGAVSIGAAKLTLDSNTHPTYDANAETMRWKALLEDVSASNWGGKIDEALAVIGGESSGRYDATNKHGENSIGLFQINLNAHADRARRVLSAPGAPLGELEELLKIPENNILVAWDLYREQGWRPWTAARNLGLPLNPPNS